MNTIFRKNRVNLLGFFALFLLFGCGAEPDPKPIEGAIDVSQSGIKNFDKPEGSATKVAPPLSDNQLAEGSKTDLENHQSIAKSQSAKERKTVVPKSVEGKWKAVKILIRDKADEENNAMELVSLGSTFSLPNSEIRVKVGPFFPNFMMDETTITSVDNELGNPAIYLVIEEKGKELYKGWIFKNYPTLYAFEHEQFGLQLMDSVPASIS